MEINYKGLLPKDFSVDEKYSVMLFIKEGSNAETYRVKGKDGKLYFLKLFNYAKLQRSAFDSDSNLLEIVFLQKIKHLNITSYKDSGELIYEGKKFGFLVLDFIAGETLAQQISRESISTYYDVKLIATGILNGLNYLHNLTEPIIHNEITLQNVMLDLSGEVPLPKIIDFSYARSFHQSSKSFNKEGLNLNYVASECFNNLYSPQSDLFSVGAVMYHLLFSLSPWHRDLSKYKADRIKIEEVILDARKKPLVFPNIVNNIVDFDESILKILRKALQLNPEKRFQSANEFLQALNGEIEIDDSKSDELKTSVNSKEKESGKKTYGNKKSNKGFSAIAGMQDLKDRLMNDVIDLINDTEGAEKSLLSG
jgi:transitional endoplasmic reticulum ATPase